MATEGKNDRDDGPARGWDLFKLRWVTEPPEALAATVYGILFIIFVLIAISGMVALWQLLAPIWIGASPAPTSAGTDPGADLRGRLLVIGALLTTPFLIWRLIVGHWAARAAQAQARVAQEQARIAQETARNTLFAKAIEQLGAVREEKTSVMTKDANGAATSSTEESAIRPNTEVRLGAIYALEKLARDDLEMHWPIMETLCAYVRENAGPPLRLEGTVLSQLGGRGGADSESIRRYQEFLKDLRRLRVDIQAALTVIGRRSQKQLNYETEIRINLDKATQRDLLLDLSNCNLAQANLSRLNLSHAIFNFSTLILGNFSNIQLDNSSFYLCNMQRVKFNFVSLRASRFDFTQLNQSEFYGCILHQCQFPNSNLTNCVFVNSDLSLSEFDQISPKNLRIESSQLSACVFRSCLFSYSWLSFLNSGLLDVKFENCSFELVDCNLTQEQLDATWGDESTVAPPGLRRPTTDKWLSPPQKWPREPIGDGRWKSAGWSTPENWN